MILINMAKAKDIKRNSVRNARAPLLDALDIEFAKASESGDFVLQQVIANKKQILRDATQDPKINNATTPEQLIAANVLELPATIVFVPKVVSRFQARAALVQSGYFEQVDAYMIALPKTDIKRMAWEDAETFDRTSATLLAMAQMLNLDSAGLDDLFVLAASIQA
jgi:hypothetical protein